MLRAELCWSRGCVLCCCFASPACRTRSGSSSCLAQASQRVAKVYVDKKQLYGFSVKGEIGSQSPANSFVEPGFGRCCASHRSSCPEGEPRRAEGWICHLGISSALPKGGSKLLPSGLVKQQPNYAWLEANLLTLFSWRDDACFAKCSIGRRYEMRDDGLWTLFSLCINTMRWTLSRLSTYQKSLSRKRALLSLLPAVTALQGLWSSDRVWPS